MNPRAGPLISLNPMRLMLRCLVSALLLVSIPVRAEDCRENPDLPVPSDQGLAQDAADLGEEASALVSADPEAAIAKYEIVLEMTVRARDIVRRATTLNNIAVVKRRIGQYEESLAKHQEALAIRRDIGGCRDIATSLNNIGVTYGLLGKEEESLENLRGAKDLRMGLQDWDRLPNTLVNIANASRRLGRYDEALAAIYEGYDLPPTEARGGLLTTEGLILEDMGRFEKAADAFTSAAKLFAENGNAEGVRVASLNLGNVSLSVSDYDNAIPAFERAVAMSRLDGDRAAAMMSLALALVRKGNGEKGMDVAREAVKTFEALNDNSQLASAYGNFGLIFREDRNTDEARRYFEKALALTTTLPVDERARSLVSRATALQAIAELDEEKGNLEAALPSYIEAVESREMLRSAVSLDELRSGFADRTTGLYQRLVRLLMRMGRPETAYIYAERARARTFVESIVGTLIDTPRSADGALLAREQELAVRMAALEAQVEETRRAGNAQEAALKILVESLAATRDEYERVSTRIRLQGGRSAASLGRLDPATVTEVRSRLAPDTVLISYFVTPTTTIAFVVTKKTFEAVEIEVLEEELEASIRRFRNFNATVFPDAESVRLHGWLIEPLLSHGLAQARNVGIVPHGPLHYLPFAALSDGTSYFGTGRGLFYLPSADMLGLTPAAPAAHHRSAAILAYSKPGLAPLEFAEQEARNVAAEYHVEPMIGSAASEGNLRKLASSSDIIHVAAHGVLDPSKPNFSRLVLASDATADGALNVYEIPGLAMNGVDLVVMSACDTVLGERSRGDEIVGLNRSFLAAGARSVVASLWTVDDESGAMLMDRFHRYLQDGHSKSEALGLAQADVRALYPSPYDWATFILTGDQSVAEPTDRSKGRQGG